MRHDFASSNIGYDKAVLGCISMSRQDGLTDVLLLATKAKNLAVAFSNAVIIVML